MSQTPSTYLDSASGEPLHPAALEVLQQALGRAYADPRRLHRSGRESRLLLDNARAVVAETLGVRADEVTFTPSGTHAVHLGVLGLLAGRARVSDRLLASAVEHSSVLHAGEWHRGRGGVFETLPVDATGRLTRAGLEAALDQGPTPALVALQSANQEVGTGQPVAEIAELLGDIPVFTDACASAGRLDLPSGWSAAALSAHKWGGPPGVGVLVVRKGARWRNPYPGDERADERSTGFENVSGALAAAAALRAMRADATEISAQHHRLTAELAHRVAQVPDTEVYLAPDSPDSPRLPHLLAFSCLYVDGETLVTELDRLGFAVASGSACTASTLQPSHVLTAMGALTHGNVRVSLARETTPEDVRRFAEALRGVVDQIRSQAGLP